MGPANPESHSIPADAPRRPRGKPRRSPALRAGQRPNPLVEAAQSGPPGALTRRRARREQSVARPCSPPSFAAGLISRPRLVRRLLDERQARLAVICAPAGYGKTSLLAEWVERDERPCAWITLDSRHGHAPALLEEVMLAVDSLEPLDDALLERCRLAAHEPHPESARALLDALGASVAAISASGHPATLVLDDAHVVESPPAREVLSIVASSIPAASVLALASRSEPPLPCGRLRAARQLLEVSLGDLALTAYEAHRLLRNEGLRLDAGAVERCLGQTEGWPAALYLVARAIRSAAAADSQAQPLARADRAVSEYVRQELLDSLPKETREFLRRCSVVDQLTPVLCDTMLERCDSADVLETLAFRDLTVLPLDAGTTWYRLHPLVRDVLRGELDARDPSAAERLSARAGRWFEQHDDLDRAIDHAVAFGRVRRAGELLWKRAPSVLARGTDPQVTRWLGSLGEKPLADSARLGLCAALTNIVEPDVAAAERWAQAAAHALDQRPEQADAPLEGGTALVEAALARGGVQEMGRAADRADRLLEENSLWRSFSWLLRGVADQIAGEHASARAKLERGVRASTTPTPLIDSLCLAQLSLLGATEHDMTLATDRCEEAAALIASHGLASEPLATLVHAVSAWLAGRSGRADEAKRLVSDVIHVLDRVDGFLPWYEVEVRILVARASIRLADVIAARAALAHASRALRRVSEAPELHAWLEAEWAELDELSASALPGPAALTIAELRILRFLPSHLSFREIGERLEVSTNTVKTQAHAVYAKLGAASRSQAVARASSLGLIEATMV